MSGHPGPPGYFGGPPAQGYPQPQQGYPGGLPQQGYPGAPPAYPGGAVPPIQCYLGGPPPQPGYSGGPPPQGQFQGGAPQGHDYKGVAPPPVGEGEVEVQWKGEIPDDDVDDNDAAPAMPSAPPLEKMDPVEGYNNVGFDTPMLPPPSYDEVMKGEAPQRSEVTGLPRIEEEEAREALLQYAAEHCCYGKGAAQNLRFSELQRTSAFHYTLETFGESRSTGWAHLPYRGQEVIDGPMNGPAPGPWDIQVNPPSMFYDAVREVEVPHTASVKPCHNCMAMGRVRCHRCCGRGKVRCSSCGGRGHKTVHRDGKRTTKRCIFCHGHGRRRCPLCHGGGMITCNCCEGFCNLKCYIKLSITWKNHLTDHIVERTALPDTLIRTVSGQVAFEEEQLRVWPINHFPDAEINTASQRLVTEHSSAFPSERLLMQRHRVRIIPVTQAFYKWKETTSDFFVYGFEKKVYAPSYPQQCCCGCTLI